MSLLSDRVLNMSTSATLAMAAKARELRAEGKDIIGLSLGEPDFNTPDFIKNAAIQAINDNYNSYTPVDGYVELKEHMERQFIKGMNWENRDQWHIDHIIPLATAQCEDDVIRLNHYTNLQPLWAEDNLSKGSKIIS